MKVHFSNSAYLRNLDSFLRAFDPSSPNKLIITANKKWVGMHPAILAMVAALGISVGKDNIECEKIEARSGHYLERMGLFKMLGIESGMSISEHDSSGRFIPLKRIRNSGELDYFITEMIPLLHLEPKQAESIRYIVSELVRNVLEHANTKHGAVLAAQYYPVTNKISLGIADAGIGIKSSINKSYNAEDDLQAIKLALTPGITGTTKKEGGTSRNAGAGLFFTKSIAKINRSFLVVYSGSGMYKLLRGESRTKRNVLYADPERDIHSEQSALPNYQGTMIGIDINLAATEEFSALLELIRRTYIEALQERRQARIRKPNFT